MKDGKSVCSPLLDVWLSAKLKPEHLTVGGKRERRGRGGHCADWGHVYFFPFFFLVHPLFLDPGLADETFLELVLNLSPTYLALSCPLRHPHQIRLGPCRAWLEKEHSGSPPSQSVGAWGWVAWWRPWAAPGVGCTLVRAGDESGLPF